MARFFIDRPVFAWVVALFIVLGGLLSIPILPVAQYPVIAPPSIALSTAYPGASVETLYTGTTRLIEDELNGAANILSFESASDAFGVDRDHGAASARAPIRASPASRCRTG